MTEETKDELVAELDDLLVSEEPESVPVVATPVVEEQKKINKPLKKPEPVKRRSFLSIIEEFDVQVEAEAEELKQKYIHDRQRRVLSAMTGEPVYSVAPAPTVVREEPKPKEPDPIQSEEKKTYTHKQVGLAIGAFAFAGVVLGYLLLTGILH